MSLSKKISYGDFFALIESTTPTAEGSIGKIYTKSDNKIYFQDGAGSEKEIVTTSTYYGGMYLNNNGTATVIATANTPIAINDFTTGSLANWTFQAGTRGEDITAYATYDSGNSTLVTTTAAHNLSAGDFITISNTTNYNAIYEVLSAPSGTTFEIDKAWDTNDDAQGYYDRGGTLIAGTGAAGDYWLGYSFSSSMAGGAGDIVLFQTMINKTACDKCRTSRKFANNDLGNVAGNSILTIADGDHLSITIESDGTNNVTNKYGNLMLHRM